MRTSIVTLDRSEQRAAARAHFGLDPDRTTLLVFGGSLGAKRLNEVVTGAAADLRDGVDAVVCLRHLVLDQDAVAHNRSHAVDRKCAVGIARERCANATSAVVVRVGGQSRSRCQAHGLVEVDA